ncbi:hypothetical protein CJ20_137 [Escherichia phage CJ20]|nr:hypothetical protein CJ20_137 [Escherichia phage CJ20]
MQQTFISSVKRITHGHSCKCRSQFYKTVFEPGIIIFVKAYADIRKAFTLHRFSCHFFKSFSTNDKAIPRSMGIICMMLSSVYWFFTSKWLI